MKYYYKNKCNLHSLSCLAPNPCDSVVCLNGGLCNVGTCDCSNTGYAGTSCEIRE